MSETPEQTDYGTDEKTKADLDRRFTYHAPKNDQQERYIKIRDHARSMAELIQHSCPHSREKSLALTRLEEVSMWANASIARNE